MNYKNIQVGDKVRTLREMRSQVEIIPIGSIGEVINKYGGLELVFENICPHCTFGRIYRITRVEPNDVELITEKAASE